MKRRIGIMMLACMVVFSLYMPTAKMGPEIGEEAERIDWGAYTFETILSGNQKAIGRETCIGGYYRLYDGGMALYYSREDYIYDTKENAVWLPERKDFSLKAMIQKELERTRATENEQIIAPTIIINELRGKNGYAATATYIDWKDSEHDPVYQNIKDLREKARKDVKYDREEVEKEPIKVSFYRLVGDPWQFDGKKIQVEGYRRGDFLAAKRRFTEENTCIGEVYDYLLNGKQVWGKIAKKYDPDGDKDWLYVQSIVYDGKFRVETTGMFYLYWPEKDYWIEDEAERGPWFKRYRFELVDMEVNEKDRENFQKDVNEFKKSVMEKEKAYEN